MTTTNSRQFTYFDRVKESFSAVNDPDTKLLCNDLLNFIDKCAERSQTRVLDFTSRKCEEQISQFLLMDREFVGRMIDNFSKFSAKGIFDLLSKDNGMVKDVAMESKSRALIKAIEKQYYQIICLSALYCPLELLQTIITKLCAFIFKYRSDSLFGLSELTVWTALLLLINPVKLKQHCDGSVEVFSHFAKTLQSNSTSQSPPRPGNTTPKPCSNNCLKGTIQLALGIAIKYARNSLGLCIPHELDEIEFVNEGINNLALEFLLAFIVQSPIFNGGDDFAFTVELIDNILKNFICYFPNKLVEMYNLCEDELQTMAEYQNQENNENYFGNEEQQKTSRAPNFSHLHFKTLLELIGALYESENNTQLIQLSAEFTNPNCEGLCDFIYRGRTISAPALKVAYLDMLRSLYRCLNGPIDILLPSLNSFLALSLLINLFSQTPNRGEGIGVPGGGGGF
uniref:Uncharacterized protein n=1 Tax=Meloidogyne javanica TaxID=6303 RepID=A0A915LMB7_MELJA